MFWENGGSILYRLARQVLHIAEVQVVVVASELAEMIIVGLGKSLFVVEPHYKAWKLNNKW